VDVEAILSLNSGSSSLKLALYVPRDGGESRVAAGAVERVGVPGGRLWITGPGGERLADERRDFARHEDAVTAAFAALGTLALPRPAGVGHRVVHGGVAHVAPERVDAALVADLRRLVPFAPLHLPAAIQAIEAVTARFPGLPQVACFDTAFHRRMPEVAQRFPLPRGLWDEGVRRYGFHGLSYEYVVERLGPAARGRTIIAHLGNGASMAAVRDGLPVDTTMGFTPTGGFMMGTRTGDLDPGILLWLVREKGFDGRRLERLVDQESGLLGVSGSSSDMKTLLERRQHDPAAALAVEMFCREVRKHVGALAAALGGLDTLVFTGGIGERAAPVRAEVCAGLGHLGVAIDAEANSAHADRISTAGSACAVRVIPTDEDLMIARHTRAVIASR
jgi:acetate kinase